MNGDTSCEQPLNHLAYVRNGSQRPLLCRFSDAGETCSPRAHSAGVRKAPRHEIAVGGAPDGAASAMGIWAGRGCQCDLMAADDRFRSKNCGIDFERAPCALRERIWGWAAGRCGATMQAGALPGESEPEWRWSMRWRIDGAGIMRCRS